MMMILKLVTFETDLTQFLVDAVDDDTAIDKAMEANLQYGNIEEIKAEAEDSRNYTVEDVDFPMLMEIFRRNDYAGHYGLGSAIVFND